MRKPKRTQIEKEQALGAIASLMAQGFRTLSIAKKLGMHRQQVQRDIKTLFLRLREASEEQALTARDLLLNEAEELKIRSWEGWYRSAAPREKKVASMEQLPGKGKKDGGQKQRSSTEIQHQAGDPQFLRVILETNKFIAGLFGLLDEQKKAETRPPVRVIWFGDAEPRKLSSPEQKSG